MSMTVSNSLASTGDTIAIAMLGKALDQQAGQMAQLLQALPPAPQPAHLGSNVDVRV